MGHILAIQGSSDQVVAAVWDALLRRGYRMLRSFDLQSAVARHAEGCACPFHGTEHCTCQYVVLLAYPIGTPMATPRVLTIHTYEGMTQIAWHCDEPLGLGESRALAATLAQAAANLEPEPRPAGAPSGLPVVAIGHG